MTLILAIESSCDETAASVVDSSLRVRSSVVASQAALHAEYAGVVPEIASRAHVERLMPVLRAALNDAGVTLQDINAIAVANRPGLIGSLLVGVAAAKAFSFALDIPILSIDHIEAHLTAGLLDPDENAPPINTLYPALGLVVSGGHTAIYRMDEPLHRERLGSTIDDAIGEAFDKVATILGLTYPGGPEIDKLAKHGNDRAHDFPVSLLAPNSLDFSFSGLKTSVLYEVRGTPTVPEGGGKATFQRDSTDLTDQQRADIAASFQRAAVRAITRKLERALKETPSMRSLVVGGGVSANSRLRSELASFCDTSNLTLIQPEMRYCIDNAAMIGGHAHLRLKAGELDDRNTLTAAPTGAR
ncbi:MAG: tRNA (adenosine(37)-N6)-threonylcarbamoyltransferase complex transferase subunit TsaD [Planctomycetota bacterium]